MRTRDNNRPELTGANVTLMSDPRASEDPPSMSREYSKLLSNAQRRISSVTSLCVKTTNFDLLLKRAHKMAVQCGPQINKVGCGDANTDSTELFKRADHLVMGPMT